jgi:hypothetical protein
MGTLAYIQHAELSHQKGALDSIKIWIAAADVEQNGFSRRDLHDVRESEHMRSNYTTTSWWWWDDALIFFYSLYILSQRAPFSKELCITTLLFIQGGTLFVSELNHEHESWRLRAFLNFIWDKLTKHYMRTCVMGARGWGIKIFSVYISKYAKAFLWKIDLKNKEILLFLPES